MRGLTLESLGSFKLLNRDIQEPGPDEVLLKVKACGICGSDIPRAFVNGPYHYPTILGHEFSGKIVKIGNGVNGDLVGRKAAVFPLLPCFKCIFCRNNHYAQCEQYDYFGSRRDGGFQEYLVIPVFNLVLLEDSVSFEEAAMIEPLTVAQHVIRKAEMKLNDSIAVFGAGPIGLMTARWAKLNGASDIFLVDVDSEKIAFATSLGFKQVYNSSEKDIQEVLSDETGKLGPDIVIEASGTAVAYMDCLKSVRAFGKVVMLGNPKSDVTIPKKVYDQFMRKEAVVQGMFNSVYQAFPNNEWEVSAKILAEKRIEVKDLITHRKPLDQLEELFYRIRDKKEFYCKAMMINE